MKRQRLPVVAKITERFAELALGQHPRGDLGIETLLEDRVEPSASSYAGSRTAISESRNLRSRRAARRCRMQFHGCCSPWASVSIRPTRQNKRLTSDSTRERHEDRCDGGDCGNSLRKYGKIDPFHKTRKTGWANAYGPLDINQISATRYVDSRSLSHLGTALASEWWRKTLSSPEAAPRKLPEDQDDGPFWASSMSEMLQKETRDVILGSIVDGVFTIDEKWRITSFNRAAETIMGAFEATRWLSACLPCMLSR